MISTLRPRILFASLLGAASLLSTAAPATAATIAVNTTADPGAACTLRNAITAANTNAVAGACPAGSGASDVIDLTSQTGTITLGSALPHLAAPVAIQGPGSGVLTVSGGDAVQVLDIDSFAGSASISGLRIAHGSCPAGCGLRNDGTAQLTDVAVDDNLAQVVGGTNAFPAGGGIYNTGTLTLTLSTVKSNVANAAGASSQNSPSGGAIYNTGTGTVILDRSTVAGNSTTASAAGAGTTNSSGGGITNFANLDVLRSTISGNTSSATGSASFNGANGGAINNANAPSVNVTIDRSTIAGNAVSASGPVGSSIQATAGGFNVFGTTFHVTSSTIAGNSAPSSANVVLAAQATLENSIIAGPLGGGSNCAGTATSLGFNLTDGTGCGFNQPTDQLSTNPQLAAGGPAANGGPTKTVAPLAGSPAVDRGKSSAGETVDQRGSARPHDFAAVANVAAGDGTDIGAVELQDTTPPETTITSGPAEGSVIAGANPSFAFSAGEAGATFECKLDGGAFAACTSPFAAGPLSDGRHTFSVRALDAAHNADATPTSRTFTVDATAPQTKVTKAKVSQPKRRAKVEFTSSEPGSTFECRLDKKPFKPCSSPARLKGLKAGKHKFQVRATDGLGNVDATPARAKVKIKSQ